MNETEKLAYAVSYLLTHHQYMVLVAIKNDRILKFNDLMRVYGFKQNPAMKYVIKLTKTGLIEPVKKSMQSDRLFTITDIGEMVIRAKESWKNEVDRR